MKWTTEKGPYGRTVLEILREVGYRRLVQFDSCLCSRCSIQDVNIDLSCPKSTGSALPGTDIYGPVLRVYSRHSDFYGAGEYLKAIAQLVLEQLADEGWTIHVRYCDSSFDRFVKCTYCEEKRQDPRGYLCEACLTKPGQCGAATLAEEKDYRRFDFSFEPKDEDEEP